MFVQVLLCGFVTAPGLLLSAASILTSPSQLRSQYDFVILGGGTAGSVLANRLSENSGVTILVIEGGESAAGDLATQVPFLGVSLPGTSVDWNFTTTAQSGLNGRSIGYARGHALGGSSVINLMTWNRASSDVWDKWASLTGDSGWSWNSVASYYKKTNTLVASADGHDTTGQLIPGDYGSGPVQVSIAGFATELDDKVINTAKQLGGRFKFNEDFNSGDNVGVGYMPSSIGGGQRSHAATAYLDAVTSRSNLDVLINTRISRLIQSGTISGKPVFGTVEMSQNGTHTYQIEATKEVLLSAGVIGTPQILLRSGIGATNTLTSIGINPLVNLPDVGQFLADHPLVPNYYYVNSNGTFDSVLRDTDVFNSNLNQWLQSKTGLFVDSPGNTQAYIRLPDNSSALKGIADPSSGVKSGHTEWIFADGFAAFGTISQPAMGNFMTILTSVVSPTSHGSVSIPSSDPFASPIINPAILSTNFDIQAMIQTMKDADTFVSAKPWGSFVAGKFGDLAKAVTDADLETYARNNAVTVNHPVGTARMSPANASWGVVDSTLLIKGVKGVRIVDASVFPSIPECHVQAPVYVVAERAADLIKSTWNL